MTHNRENLRLSLHDLQQTTTAPINSSSSSSSVSQSMSVIANQAITTVANKFTKGVGVGGGTAAAYQNEKCERLKKMTSITCSDSEDDSERRIQMDGNGKWQIGGYEGDTRTHIVHEIFRNEQSYVESLQTMVNRYLKALKSPEHAGVIEARTVDEIFFMVPDILEIHEKFLAELRNRLDNWDTQQKVGDAFMETFSKLEVLEVYTSFVNNCSRAKNAIRTTKHQRPAFAKFLETTAREHKGKLTLDYLLIKPVQKFPNYELLFQRLIKHTDHDHPDQKHLQDVLKLVHDILVHINCKEREILENGQREATLRELEGVIEGITDLIAPDRQFLLFDLVTMPSGQGARKERGFFLFNDLLVLTSIKKRSGTIRKPNTTTCPGTVASTLDTNKYKFLTKISLDCLEIVKTKDENIKRIMTEIENLAEDCNKLQQISEITSSLKMPHQYLEDVIRELHRDAQRQLSERQTNDAQLNMLELAVNSPNGTQKLSIVFSKSEKRTQWEETFNEAKQKLAATLERHPIPEFLTSIPIRKTRAGLQFTCAAATLSEKRDVWVCNSDGYVGQVCIMSLHPEPNVTSCNGVCNARILCVASVPAYSPHSSSIKSTSSSNDEHSVSSAATTNNNSTQQHQQQHHHHQSHHQQHSQQHHHQQQQQQRSSLPPLSYTQQLLDYRKSISPNYSNPSSLIGTPEKKRDKSQSNSIAGGGSSSSVAASITSGGGGSTGGGANSSDIQLDLNLSSSDEEAEAANAAAAASSGVTASSGGGVNSGICERVPSPAPSTHTTGSTSTASTAIVGSSSTLYHGHQDSNPDESDGNQSTMWIGTEDGCIHVYNSTDNIRIKKNRIKIEHHAAVYSILYLDNRVFVALANGDICVYLRDGSVWNTTSSHCLSIGTVTSPVTKLLNVHGKLWCSIQGIIKVLDIETLAVVNQIQISSDSKPITNMCVSSNYVWISIQNSAHIKCFHSNTHQLITEVNLAQAVNKMLSNCDEIIRQHKAACLRVTSLLSCRDLIWIGTSAGVLLTIPSQGYEKGAPNVVPTGIPHGHTGHVRFLTYVETTGASGSGASSTEGGATKEHDTNAGSKSPKPKGENSANSATNTPGNILIISGGDGYEDFRNSGANSLSEIAGREDSTNHLLIWQI
ncbi:rho guanine nucleotide exchange factor 17 isoform X2 [Musca autumnalis]|uniref:rho guanine nucleotide exchange factor 17 isoform X2 n=1 Tax=Musca autumnalis TaxID=221902 RepID=UPI003CF2F83F